MSFFGKLLDDPLKTAALGAGLYFTGGAIAPYLGMGEAVAGAAAMGPQMATAGAPLLDAAGVAIAPESAGLLGTAKTAASYMKPVGDAAGAAGAVKGLLGDNGSHIQAPQVMQGNPAGAQTLASLYQQGVQVTPEDQARMQRRMMWG
jgi:hypothetical protein